MTDYYSPYDLLRRRLEPLEAKFNPSGIGPGMSYGKLLSILADYMPGVGDVKAGVDAVDAAQQGDILGAGLAGLGVVPFVGSLKNLPIRHPDLRKAPMEELISTMDQIRNRNVQRGLNTDIATGSIRDEIARRNAVDMLGLPETNTALDRANALGYTQDAYHGTPGYEEIGGFGSAEHRGRATKAKSAKMADWASSSPEVAESYSYHSDPTIPLPPSPEIDSIDKRLGDIWEEIKRLRDKHNVPHPPSDLEYSPETLKAYNEGLDRQIKFVKEDPEYIALIEEQVNLHAKRKELDKARLQQLMDMKHRNILPLRVKDATTFNPKQEDALTQLNAIIGANERNLTELPEYKTFEKLYSEQTVPGPHDPYSLVKSFIDEYDNTLKQGGAGNEFLSSYYDKVGFNKLYEKIKSNPSLLGIFDKSQKGKLIKKIPTVYDAKGKYYGKIPKGLSGQIKMAPEGTEVFRFDNLVDPEPVSTHYAIMKPNAVRSRFAAFDPARKDESNLLASIAAGGLSIPLLLRMLEEDQYGY